MPEEDVPRDNNVTQAALVQVAHPDSGHETHASLPAAPAHREHSPATLPIADNSVSQLSDTSPNSATPELNELASKVRLIDGSHNNHISLLLLEHENFPPLTKGGTSKVSSSKHKHKQGSDKGGPKSSSKGILLVGT